MIREGRLAAGGLVLIALLTSPDARVRAAGPDPLTIPTSRISSVQVLTPPLAFEPNHGQFDAGIRFVLRGRGYMLALTDEGALLSIRGSRTRGPAGQSDEPAMVRLSLDGALPSSPVADEALPGIVNYFIGNDQTRWLSGVPTYGRVRYAAVQPGIDLVYYGRDGALEYDLVVAPGADPSQLAMRIDGADDISRDDTGNLVLSTAAGLLTMRVPEVYQQFGEQRRSVDARYSLDETGRVAFELGPYDRREPLVIDPQLVMSTFLGGSGNGVDQANGIAVDSKGSPYIVGTTETTDFPVKSPLQSKRRGQSDAVVTKLTPDGLQMVYSTYLGGGSYDYGTKIAVTADGLAYVVGDTSSSDFPVKSAAQSKLGGQSDMFVVALNASGSAISKATFLGGNANEVAGGVEIGYGVLDGGLFVHGTTRSTNFPTKAPAQAHSGGGSDAFVAAYDRSTLQPVFQSYAGQAANEQSRKLVINPARGDLYLALDSDAGQAPVGHFTPLQSAMARPAAVAVSSWSLSFKTIGVPASVSRSAPRPSAPGNLFTAMASIFPPMSAYRAAPRGTGPSAILNGALAFATQGCVPIAPATTCSERAGVMLFDQDVRYIRHFNFGGQAVGRMFIVDGGTQDTATRLHLIGSTSDSTLPVVSPVQGSYKGSQEGFIITLDPETGATSFFSYLGGSSFDTLHDIAVDANGNRWIVGETQSNDFPVTRSGVQPNLRGRIDGFVVKITP